MTARNACRVKLSAGFALSAAMFASASAWGQDAAAWRPAKGPLASRFAADVNPTNSHPEYPRPQLVRSDWLNLNGLWDYAIVPGSFDAPAGFQGQILVPFPVDSALSGVMQPLSETNSLWYRRRVAVPASWRGRHVRLHFGAVDWQARVTVNGKSVGQHRGGYDRFSFDITDQLRWNGEEEIVVVVTDLTEGDQPRGKQSRKQEGIFYTATSGIWQTVWLEPVPKVCIDQVKSTPDVDAKSLRLRVAANSLSEKLRAEAVATIDGKEVGRVSGLPNTELILALPKPRLWSPDDPFLYDLRVTLKEEDKILDSVSSYFGMRKIALGKDDNGFTRMALNDQFLFQVGTLDQGFWPDGIYTAPTDEALRSDIEFLKKAGFNLTRKHVKVEPDRWYYWCDKLGLLVWQDMPSGNNATVDGRRNFESELRRMIEDLENHPSIVVWVLFNEGWGQYETERLTQWLKKMDPSRLVDNASGWTDMRAGDLIDVHSYPGPDSRPPESSRAAALGEFGGLGLPVEGHSWSTNCWGYLMLPDRKQLAARYTGLFKQVWALHKHRGLSAAIYTQTTDVETECNGLLTYDRAVTKIDPDILLAASRGVFPGPPMKTILADATLGRMRWKYTFERPGDDWFKTEFDATGWKEGEGGFGTAGTPNSFPNTEWNTSDIWLRCQFSLTPDDLAGLKLHVYHDEDAEIYLNGVLALKLQGFATEYDEFDISTEAAAALHPGNNTIAAHCLQTTGGQGIDVGIVAVKPDKPAGDPKGN
jgi:glycosyl hydrolase family 2